MRLGLSGKLQTVVDRFSFSRATPNLYILFLIPGECYDCTRGGKGGRPPTWGMCVAVFNLPVGSGEQGARFHPEACAAVGHAALTDECGGFGAATLLGWIVCCVEALFRLAAGLLGPLGDLLGRSPG